MTKLSNGSILLPSIDQTNPVNTYISARNEYGHPSTHRVIDPESAGYKRLLDSKGNVLARRDASKLIHEPTPLEVALITHDPFYKKVMEDEKLAVESCFFPL